MLLPSLAVALLAAGSAGGPRLQSGSCPPGLVRPSLGMAAPRSGGAVTISEGVRVGEVAQLSAPRPAFPLDCLFDRDHRMVAALFPPQQGLPGAEIVIYDPGGALSANGRVLSAPAGSTWFDTLPSSLRDQITDLLHLPREEQPTPQVPEPVGPDPAVLKAASYNPPRPAPANVSENLRVIDRTWDDFNRLETETVDLEGGGTGTVRYTYYRNGLRKTVTDTVGRVTFYEYNGVNLLSRVTTNYGEADVQVTRYDYWPDKLLKAIHWPNGVDTAYDYDYADRLTTITLTRGQTRLAAYTYGYDANDNRTSQIEENGGAPELTGYEYDDLDRLELVRYPDGRSVEYGYDAVGNRTSETTRDANGTIVSAKTAVFDPVNRLSTVTDAVDPAGNASFTYDKNGNLLTKTTAAGVQELFYDTRDLLVETREGSSITARFAYDAFGRRYFKVGEEGVRQYLFDQTSVLEELDEHGVEVARYEYGSTQLQSFFRRDEPRRYYHLDGLGSVTALSDASGDMVARYHLDAWGNFRDAMELEASRNRFAFTGYQWDRETGLYNAKARLYDPVYGRFTSQDSYLGQIDDPPSLHRYFYGNANPVRYVDPTGHWSWKDVWKGLANTPRAMAEPALWVYDTTQVVGARAWGISSDFIKLQSAVGRRQQQRIEEGQSKGKAALKGGIETPAAVFSFGITAFLQSQVETYQDFASGKIGIDEYDERLSQIAGGQVGAALAGAAGSKATGRTWTGRTPVAPKGAGAVTIVEGDRAANVPVPAEPVIDMVQNGDGKFVPVWEADGANSSGAGPPLPRVAGGSQGVDQRAVQPADPSSSGSPRAASLQRLAGPKLEHLNAAIAEQRGYAAALEKGQIGIQAPDKVTAKGPDYITFDPAAQEVVIWDAKYRGPAGGSAPSSIPAGRLQRWMPEVRNAIEAMPDGAAKQQAMKAFDSGAVRGRIFQWPQ